MFQRVKPYGLWVILFFCAYGIFNWRLPTSSSVDCKPPSGFISGRITSLPFYVNHHVSFDFHALDVTCQGVLRLTWYGITPDLTVGDAWRLKVSLAPPREIAHLPWEASQFFMPLPYLARATVHTEGAQRLSSAQGWSGLDRLRQHIAENIFRSVASADRAMGSILVALTVGSRHLMRRETWQVFQNTGTSHLIAISGLHVGLVAGVAMTVMACLWRMIVAGEGGMPRFFFSAIGGLLVATLYAALAGLGPSTQRAWGMLMVMLLGQFAYRSWPLGWSLRWVFVGMLVLLPASALSISFWLSFAAIALLLYLTAARLCVARNLATSLWIQFKLFLGLMPLNLFFFQNCR